MRNDKTPKPNMRTAEEELAAEIIVRTKDLYSKSKGSVVLNATNDEIRAILSPELRRANNNAKMLYRLYSNFRDTVPAIRTIRQDIDLDVSGFSQDTGKYYTSRAAISITSETPTYFELTDEDGKLLAKLRKEWIDADKELTKLNDRIAANLGLNFVPSRALDRFDQIAKERGFSYSDTANVPFFSKESGQVIRK